MGNIPPNQTTHSIRVENGIFTRCPGDRVEANMLTAEGLCSIQAMQEGIFSLYMVKVDFNSLFFSYDEDRSPA